MPDQMQRSRCAPESTHAFHSNNDILKVLKLIHFSYLLKMKYLRQTINMQKCYAIEKPTELQESAF